MSLARAIETGDLAQLPSRREEDWRWTDLRGLIRVLPGRSATYAGELAAGPFDALADRHVNIVNGESRTRLTIAQPGPGAVALRFVSAEASAHSAHPEINVAPGGSLTLLETYEGSEGDYLSEIDLTINVGEGARLERIVLAADGPDAVSVSRADITLSPGARLIQTVITGGAKRQRLETRVSHPGHGAEVRLDGLYVLADRRHADITTVVTHEGVDGTTDQLTKGVVRDQSRGIFQGRITVERGADRTDARMGHHALVLSDRAEVDAKPELEIYADDVACAHGNTVGALDEDALFYAEQRGIPEAEARAMLTEAFVGEVVDRIAHEGAREVVRAWVAERLRPAP
jgi:Fe-S cluster assembly protein SufD